MLNTQYRNKLAIVLSICAISVLVACSNLETSRNDIETEEGFTFIGMAEQVAGPETFNFDDVAFTDQSLDPEDEAMSVMVTDDGRTFRMEEDLLAGFDFDGFIEENPDFFGGAYPQTFDDGQDEVVLETQIQIGNRDTRRKVRPSQLDDYPYRAIGRIIYPGFTGGCTGALIGPRHVLTAAHCLHDGNATGEGRQWYWPIRFAPGIDGTGDINGAPRRAVKRYAYYNYRQNRAFDIGLIVLQDRPETASLGQFGVRSYAGASKYNLKTVSNHGYPLKGQRCPNGVIAGQQRYQDCDGNDMWGMSCFTMGLNGQNIRHVCDTRKGHSGSPIYDSSRAILGVHWGTQSSPDFNEAARLRPKVLSRLAVWIRNNPSSYRSSPSWVDRF